MRIDSLSLVNFRNYDNAIVDFIDGLNVLKGVNASGKTNLLESAYVAGVGKSLRTTQDKELVKWGAEEAKIRLRLTKKNSKHVIDIGIDKKGAKRVLIDGIPQVKIAELLGYLNIVFFSPDELKLIKEGPQERRRFMDISLCQQSRPYLKALTVYNKALTHRNKLLKTPHTPKAMRDMLDVFDIQLARAGAAVICGRLKFASNISGMAGEWHKKISGGRESIEVSYETLPLPKNASKEDVLTALSHSLAANRDKDTEQAHTGVGPHRDDLKIIINGVDVRKFGSQGQQRSAALSLKLAEIESFKLETGETPVLLLDDVLSELDLDRQKNLLDAAGGVQTILTCTHFELEAKNVREFEIAAGKIL